MIFCSGFRAVTVPVPMTRVHSAIASAKDAVSLAFCSRSGAPIAERASRQWAS